MPAEPSPLDRMNPTELLAAAAMLMLRAEELPKGDPKVAKPLQGARRLLDRAKGVDGDPVR